MGLVSAPAWVPIAGGLAGLVTVGSGIKIGLDRLNYKKQFHAIRVGYQVCSLIAAATPGVALQEDLARILHQYNLNGDDLWGDRALGSGDHRQHTAGQPG